jgi:hypothetical protein
MRIDLLARSTADIKAAKYDAPSIRNDTLSADSMRQQFLPFTKILLSSHIFAKIPPRK